VCVTIDGVQTDELDLLATCIYRLELHFTDHWYTQTSVRSLLQFPLAVSWLLPMAILRHPCSRCYCSNCNAPCLQDNFLARAMQETHPILLYRCVYSAVAYQRSQGGLNRKHRSSISAFVYVAGVTYQQPLFTKELLNNGSIRHNFILHLYVSS
jgi:hypothetical protein